ncbi:hypothetical protein [Streptomyces sp. SR-10]|uniref:hypothetical protein n=1 Tax=Streptomyces sp. SR-10 TaxID=3416442 RepID=UPI003CF29662
MTAQPERLHHLLDRARRGVILPAEGEALAQLVSELERRADTSDAVAKGNLQHVKQLIPAVQQAEARARELEADNARYEEVVGELNEANTSLQRDVARLTAGQCTDSRAMCEKHHQPPVDGCPYPRCRAAQASGRAATA